MSGQSQSTAWMRLLPRWLRRRLYSAAQLRWIWQSPSIPVIARTYDQATYDILEARHQTKRPDPTRFGLTWAEVRPLDVAPGRWPIDRMVTRDE